MSLLSKVKTGVLEEPYRLFVYGQEGVGKSTFAADAPSPIFISTEHGTAHLDIARLDETSFGGKITWPAVLETLTELTTTGHDYKTLVIDTINWLEPVVWDHVCEKNGWKDIGEPDWGKGYAAAVVEWRGFVKRLETLQAAKEMNIIFLGHSHIKPMRHPTLSDFDRIEIAMNIKAAAVLKQWCKAVLYADYETYTHKVEGRERAVDTGHRLLHCNWRAAHDAKNRYDLPDSIPLSWEEFDKLARNKDDAMAEAMATFDELIELMNDDDIVKAMAYREKEGKNLQKMNKLIDRMKGKIKE